MFIHSYVENSISNGPGERFVIWTQGCSIRCPCCFNVETHAFNKGEQIKTSNLVNLIKNKLYIEGVTISGGEPFDQKEELLLLVKEIRSNTSLSIIVYSGYEYNYLIKDTLNRNIIANIDVLIDGRFEKDKKSNKNYKGSINQQLFFISNRYTKTDFENLNIIEFDFTSEGIINIIGFPSAEVNVNEFN